MGTYAEPHRHSRPLRDLVENLLDAQLLEHLGDEIEFSLRHPAAQDQYVGLLNMSCESFPQHLFVIAQVVGFDFLETVPASEATMAYAFERRT